MKCCPENTKTSVKDVKGAIYIFQNCSSGEEESLNYILLVNKRAKQILIVQEQKKWFGDF